MEMELTNTEKSVLQENVEEPINYIRVGNYDNVDGFFGRDNHLAAIHSLFEANYTVAIIGEGGIGKTQLAKRYVSMFESEYKNIIFILAENSEIVKSTFIDIAVANNIKVLEREPYVKCSSKRFRSTKDIIRDVYKLFDNIGSTLVVFDNVDRKEDIEEFIPRDSFENIGPRILITSKHMNWLFDDLGRAETIELENFTEQEAIDFVKRDLKFMILKDVDVRKLVELSGRYPLSLKLMINFITQASRETTNVYSITNYVNEYVKNSGKFTIYRETFDFYVYSALVAWDLAFEKMMKRSETGTYEKKIMHFMCYFNRNNLCNTFGDMSENFHNCLRVLNDYALISLKKNSIDLHYLIQEFTRNMLKKTQSEERTLDKVLSYLESSYKTDVSMMIHAATVWETASDYQSLIDAHYNLGLYGPLEYLPISLMIMMNYNIDTIKKLANCQKEKIPDERDRKGNSVLHLATVKENLDLIKFFIKIGCNVDMKNSYGATALHVAVQKRNKEITEFLSNQSCIIDKNDALYIAVRCGYEDMVDVLINNGADLQYIRVDGETLLHCVAKNGDPNMTKYLLERGIDKNVKDVRDRTAFDVGALYGNIKCLEVFCENECDFNTRLSSIKTVLSKSFIEGNMKVVNFLMDKCDIKPVNDIIQTGIVNAITQNKVEILEIILKNDWDLYSRNENGQTVLHLAAAQGSVKVVEYLLNKDFDINVEDKRKNTPLHLAVKNKQKNVVNLLIQHPKCNVDAKNDCNETPLAVADRLYYSDIVDILQNCSKV